MSDPTAERLAGLSRRYRGMKYGEQEYELAVALADIGERTPVPDLGIKETWKGSGTILRRKLSSSASPWKPPPLLG